MNFDLDDNQILFKETVERFCSSSDIATRHKTRKQPGGIDRARWRELADLGLISIAAAGTDGGLDGTLIDCAVVAQALGRGQAVEPWLECGFLPARLLAGSPRAAAVVDGSVLASFAFAEPKRRFELDAKTMRATGNKLRGEKTFVLNGGAADCFMVTADDDGETALFVVDRGGVGVDVRGYPLVDGSIAAEITLRGAVCERLSAPIDAIIDDARLMAAAEMAGLAQRLFDDTLAYVKTREQFGQPIGRFQVIQHRLVDCYAKVEQIQSTLLRALLMPSAPRAAVKAAVAGDALWIAHQAVQLHGGMGTSDDLGIGHGLKRILLLSKLFGDDVTAPVTYAQAA